MRLYASTTPIATSASTSLWAVPMQHEPVLFRTSAAIFLKLGKQRPSLWLTQSRMYFAASRIFGVISPHALPGSVARMCASILACAAGKQSVFYLPFRNGSKAKALSEALGFLEGLLMPIISLCSPKGGAGKTTTAALAATVLADQGESVTMIDADPNRTLMRWAKRPGFPKNLAVKAADADSLIDQIEDAVKTSKFVFVDPEGTKNLVVSYAIQKSHLVVIPCRGSQPDAESRGRANRHGQDAGARRGQGDSLCRLVHADPADAQSQDASLHRGAIRRDSARRSSTRRLST